MTGADPDADDVSQATGQDVAGLFRVYSDEELGADGYPLAWHQLPMDETIVEFLTGERKYGIKDIVRAEAGHRCIRCGHPYQNGQHGDGEWSECDEKCDHDGPWLIDGFIYKTDDPLLTRRPQWPYTTPHKVSAQWRILTVHHLDGDKANCRWWNLASLCQRCHLTIQGRVKLERAFIFEHSEWFKPYAAGWYAWKYLGEEISRDEAAARQDELLGLERLA